MDDIFWRNRVKITSKTPHAEKQMGDITCTHSIGLPFIETFNLELKSGYARVTVNRAKKMLAQRNAERARKGKPPALTAVSNSQWDLLDVIDSDKIDDNLAILKFWKQCDEDARLSQRIPLLIFKRDFHDPVVCIEYPTFQKAGIVDKLGDIRSRRIELIDNSQHLHLDLYRHDNFFNWLKPETIKFVHSRKEK
jgi:hypothetical protein